MKIKIEKLQNEKVMAKEGITLPEVGTVADIPVTGIDESHFNYYELKGLDGRPAKLGCPVAYGKDDEGNDYLICYNGAIEAFKTVRKY